MSRTSTLILLGTLTILTPFSGLPIAIRTFLAVIFGACVVGIGVALRAREARMQQQSVEDSLPSTTIKPTTPEPMKEPHGVSPI